MSTDSHSDDFLHSHLSPRQNQGLRISPSNPQLEVLSSLTTSLTTANGSRAKQAQIKSLSLISGEDGSSSMHPSLPPFLSTLTSISSLHIAWHSLDWNALQYDQLQALRRLVSLESLDELEIVASQNFPLDLLQMFSGTQLYLTFAGTLIQQMPTQPPPPTRESLGRRALERLSLVGQRNIVAFMEYFQNKAELRNSLRSLEFLSITCTDNNDQFESEKNLELMGHFLKFLDGSSIRELRVQDERPNATIGHSPRLQGLLSLPNIRNFEAHLRIKHVESPHEVYSAFKDWFTSLFSGLSQWRGPRVVDITYQVIFSRPPRWLTALIEGMGRLWGELDVYLVNKFPVLQQVNLGFQFHGVGGHDRWMGFNAENQPVQLNEKGVDCSFWVRDI